MWSKLKSNNLNVVLLLILTPLAMSAAGCGSSQKMPLKVLFAGSLMVPFTALEQAYEAQHPEIDVQLEGHGSIQVVRHVAEIHDLVDVAVTADYILIPMLMYQGQVLETNQPYADWTIKFASNRLGLAYTPQSQYAHEITTDNWYDVIARPGVKLGLSDPRLDASGYRTLMVFQLAEAIYDKNTIFENLTLGRFKMPISVKEEAGQAVVHVPEILQPKPDSGIVLRGSSIQLIALLESGDIDYAFEYESVIQQHGFEMIPLPDTLNLGAEDKADFYNQVQVRLDFQRFTSVKPEFNGETIGYGLTIPANAPHPQEAAEFINFLLGPEGQALMVEHHHPLLAPCLVDQVNALPDSLQSLCQPMP
jgi:molybdate/tungstate transport system substrate-binding protein